MMIDEKVKIILKGENVMFASDSLLTSQKSKGFQRMPKKAKFFNKMNAQWKKLGLRYLGG